MVFRRAGGQQRPGPPAVHPEHSQHHRRPLPDSLHRLRPLQPPVRPHTAHPRSPHPPQRRGGGDRVHRARHPRHRGQEQRGPALGPRADPAAEAGAASQVSSV